MQALAVPIMVAAVAGFGAYIAWQQMKIARNKLHHDRFEKLYDRRIAVYEAIVFPRKGGAGSRRLFA